MSIIFLIKIKFQILYGFSYILDLLSNTDCLFFISTDYIRYDLGAMNEILEKFYYLLGIESITLVNESNEFLIKFQLAQK